MTRPKVAIGMPVYNGEDYLKEAIESILSQDYTDLELIISDNASIDGTEDICRRYASEDSRIKYFRSKKNWGAAYNFKLVFNMSSSPYFKWAAHDDICGEGLLSACIKELEKEENQDYVLCYPRSLVIDQYSDPQPVKFNDFSLNLPTPHERLDFLIKNLKECDMVHGVIRSAALQKSRLIDKFFASDVVLLAELALQGNFFLYPERLFLRRIHPKTSRQANRTYEEVSVWFDPANKGKTFMPLCKIEYEILRSIQRSSLPMAEKRKCMIITLKEWHRRYWRIMGGEIKLGIKQSFVKSFSKKGVQV